MIAEPSWDGWDDVTDVVVVGTGIAGGAAAVAATKAGASVLIVDKAEHPGGTTALSGGGMWIPNNSALRAQGISDDRDTCIRYMARSADPAGYRPAHPTLGLPADRFALICHFFDNASTVIDELVGDGILTLDPFHFPDYYSDLPEAVPWGHSLVPRLPASRRRGDPGGGELLVARLKDAAEARGASTRLACEVVDVVTDDETKIVGIVAHSRGTTLLIGARRGVVFATGGFLHNRRYTREWLRGPLFGGAAATTSTGDFVAIASRAGAALGNMSQAPNRVTFMIFDDPVRTSDNRSLSGIHGSRMARFPVPFPEERPDYLITGATWRDLTDAIQRRLAQLEPQLGPIELDPDFSPNLAMTVARFNGYASSGYDPDHHRGRTLIEQAWAPSRRPGAACDTMHPFSQAGPYHCVILGAGAIDTKGGPLTDCDGRVLAGNGRPVPGLFGAGNCVASPSGQAYWSPGCSLRLAITFGYLAGRQAAAEPDHVPTIDERESRARPS